MHAHEMLQDSHRNKQQHNTPRTNEREVQQQHEENERKAQRKPKFYLKLRKLCVLLRLKANSTGILLLVFVLKNTYFSYDFLLLHV